MEIHYTAQREDVGALLRYNLRHSSRLWVVLLVVAVFPTGVATAASLMSGRWPRSGEIVFDLILGVALVAVMLLRAWARTKPDERVLSIGPEGIHTTIGHRSADLPWMRIASVDVTPEYIFITGKNANGFAIPARAFASPVERTEFLLEVEAARNPRDQHAAI
ncbi:MAG TPA: YcxB family protein [Gemmatimonadaceae bacterium]|nr:YcxB family protein [Gemmatimonadaceae bacterium]